MFQWRKDAYSHQVDWKGSWRETLGSQQKADMAVREQFGHHTKSAVSYVFERDTRDHRVFPSQGASVKVLSEFAGFGSDAKYWKNDVKINLNQLLFQDLVSITVYVVIICSQTRFFCL